MTKAQFMTVLSLTNRQGFQTLGYLKLTAGKWYALIAPLVRD
jgi:hypothetical protein